ncbi:MAG: zinc-ribbon domain-containing protein [Chloroflexi bacterium]|nr:MAG: zinc-ribbon domain-containing protein [Chloroflexota bacterium]
MTKKSLGYVRLEWTCPACGTKNPGPQTTCQNCGAPQPDDLKFDLPVQAELVSEAEELARAKAGPDIHCYYCGTRNPATAKTCSQCGAPLEEGTARQQGEVIGAFSDKPAPPVICPNCGASNAPNAPVCAQCGASLAAPPPKAEPATPKPVRKKAGILGIGLAAALVLLVCAAGIALLVWASRTEAVTGQVEQVQWERQVAIEALVPVTYETWRAEIPDGAAVGNCTQKVHHTQDEPAPNAEEVCGTPYVVDTGSGYGEVVQDCRYRVYADWCEYQVPEWRVVDRVTLSGSDGNPRWPEPALQSGQRLGPRQERYIIVFAGEAGRYTYETSDETLFRQATIGSRWVLKVNAFNAVTAIEPVQ